MTNRLISVPEEGFVVQTMRDLPFQISQRIGEDLRLEIDRDGEVRITLVEQEKPPRRRGRFIRAFAGGSA